MESNLQRYKYHDKTRAPQVERTRVVTVQASGQKPTRLCGCAWFVLWSEPEADPRWYEYGGPSQIDVESLEGGCSMWTPGYTL